jgi:aspartyl-tRNA(Asn)/glutamyl-tRNA(Gln) amidotransferase subunit B
VEAAIEAEALRQADVLGEGGRVVQATMAFDPVRGTTRVLRLKEDSDDYRYFPDPDLIPLVVSPEQIEAVRAGMPELPEERRARLEQEHGLSGHDAGILTGSRALADFYEAAVAARLAAGGGAQAVANWVLRDLLRALKESGLEIEDARLTPEAFPAALMARRGLEAVSDEGVIEAAVAEVIGANPDAVESVRQGDQKAINFLMGRVMKATRGKADPARVRELLLQKLA